MMRRAMIAVLLVCAGLLGAAETVFVSNFDTPEAFAAWGTLTGARFDAAGGRNGSGAFRIDCPTPSQGLATLKLPVEKLRGNGVRFEGWLKGENISVPGKSYLGPKLMMIVKSPAGTEYPDQVKEFGSYDWKPFGRFARIPADAESVELAVGLQDSTGTLLLDDLKVEVIPFRNNVTLDGAFRLPELPKSPKFRGVMSGADLGEEAFQTLADWNVNLIRFQIGKRPGEDNVTEAGFRKLVERGLERLDRTLPFARKYGIKLAVDLHFGPGTVANRVYSNQLSWDPGQQELLVRIWREIAEKYKGEPAIYGYDIMNEPSENDYVYIEGNSDWNGLSERIARAIREVDPVTPIIVEPVHWGQPAGFRQLEPLNLPNIIYSFHFYAPYGYTHQAVFPDLPGNIRYPGEVGGVRYDRAALLENMRPAIEFQRKHQVPIFIGEFSVVRWAPDAADWLDDVISIFEEHGWDWTYHAFREFGGWSVEHSDDRADETISGRMNPRKQVLLNYLKRNQQK